MLDTQRTKIIATIGPACANAETLTAMLKAGVSLVRLNYSHSDQATHAEHVKLIRACAAACNKEVGIVADLQGPKIRIGRFASDSVQLEEGALFTLDAQHEVLGDSDRVAVDYENLFSDSEPGDVLLLNDGYISLEVEAKTANSLTCRVLRGGELSHHKGINKQGGGLSATAISEKDEADLAHAVQLSVDYIAISFVREANDVAKARRLVSQAKGQAGIIAKIERQEALENIQSIIQAADAVMVARGDLGVEIGDAQVPKMQKMIIQRARAADRAVITATQMMESMIHTAIPTRAEISDVANAVLDGTDAVMLSAETAVGEYPLATVEAMQRACYEAERNPSATVSGHRLECTFQQVDEAIAMATMYTANHLRIKAIIALTESGSTTVWMSRIRSGIPIYGLTRHISSARRMTLYRGVFPLHFDPTQCASDDVNKKAVTTLLTQGKVTGDDLVIITKGAQMGTLGGTNTMQIVRVNDCLG